jgi:hypothetical protein
MDKPPSFFSFVFVFTLRIVHICTIESFDGQIITKKKSWKLSMLGECMNGSITTTKCGCSPLVLVHWTNEFTASSLVPIHYSQWILSKFSEITWYRDTFCCNGFECHPIVFCNGMLFITILRCIKINISLNDFNFKLSWVWR